MLMEKLINRKLIPAFAIILKEDDHETEKYSERISDLLNKYGVQNSIKKKLTETDHELIKSSNLDFIIVYGWRTLIDYNLNSFLKLGMIAVHHSLLPKYRGFAPIQWAIINGETETGVTLFQINEGEIDSGKIIAQQKIPIQLTDYGWNVEEKATQISIELLLQLFENHKTNNISFQEQNEKSATYTCKRIPDDGKINWHQTSLQIYNLIRALAHPNPGAFCFYEDHCYNIIKASLGESNNKTFTGKIPGRIYKIFTDGIEVICGEGTIHLELWKNKINNSEGVPSGIVKSVGNTLK